MKKILISLFLFLSIAYSNTLEQVINIKITGNTYKEVTQSYNDIVKNMPSEDIPTMNDFMKKISKQLVDNATVIVKLTKDESEGDAFYDAIRFETEKITVQLFKNRTIQEIISQYNIAVEMGNMDILHMEASTYTKNDTVSGSNMEEIRLSFADIEKKLNSIDKMVFTKVVHIIMKDIMLSTPKTEDIEKKIVSIFDGKNIQDILNIGDEIIKKKLSEKEQKEKKLSN